ncbi:non-ribosomal peptide synthetase/MFS transporter [Cellulosilyticum ruminicola]|uniref:non-ribosomal peptide synthetase/MFS transporter n=1 Tax=Cellulosilyticum ruminicola TaxID=425254 RepID=UPI0006D1E8B6|nr:non-ribosomal peptide synthetase/MFS transporter [Cellulosilyticum ruminicola]
MDEKMKLLLKQREKLIELNKKKQKALEIPVQPREAGEITFPVSSAQRRIWFMHQMQPDSIEYNVPVAYTIKGDFNVTYCKEALNEVVQRHEILRTTFKEVDGEPMQVIHQNQEVNFTFLDFSMEEASSEKDEKIDISIKQMVRQPFDLSTGPLLRCMLVKVEENKHILAIVAQHSIIDSWSLDILKGEFAKSYLNKYTGQGEELPSLAIQYGDYSVWQQNRLKDVEGANLLKYWVDKLKDKIPQIELPLDYERPPIRSEKGDNYLFKIEKEETKQINQAAAKNECTTFMYLLAAFQVLLYHYTNQERITVGTTVAVRPTPETEQLIGFFINNISFNTYIGDQPIFKVYLQRVKEETLQMYKKQEVPFEKVVEQLHLKRDLSRTAIYQVMFSYLSAAGNSDKIQGLDSEVYLLGGSKATTDLNLFVWEEDNRFHLNVEYSTQLFKKETIKRLADHYKKLVLELTQNPDIGIHEVNFLSDTEKEMMLQEEVHHVIRTDKSLTMHKLFEEQVVKTPDNIAITFEGKEVDYKTLNKKANQIAHHLVETGVQIGDCIGLFMDRSIEMIIGMLGVLKAGGTYVPLDTTYPAQRIEKIIKEANVKQVLTQRYLLGNIPEVEDIRLGCVDTLLQNEAENKIANLNLPITGEHFMYVLFTSGSTGEPKGVMIKHRNYVSYIKAIMNRLEVKEPLQFAIITTFAADLGSVNIYAPLLSGGGVHIIAYEKATDVDWLAEYFKNNAIDAIKMVPSHFEALQIGEQAKYIVPRKMIIFAGEAVSKETAKKVWKHRPECRVFNNYGPTETTVSVLAYEVKKESINEISAIPLGKPLSNSYVYVLNNQMQPVPYGVTGELYIGGEGVSAGYLGREDLTKERFIQDPFQLESGRMIYKTGDMVKRLADGNILFLGRGDRQVKIRGYRVELGAVEKVLREADGIEEAVLNVKKEDNNQFMIAYVILKDKEVTTTTLRKFIKEKLPDYMMPNAFVILDTLPITANGKINYAALPVPSTEEQLEETYVAPRNEVEQELVNIWCEVLGLNKVGIDDNFFDLGGESFKAIRMTRLIGRGISVIDLFKFPTIRELYERISGQAKEEEGRLIRLTPKTNKPVKMNYICFPFAGGSAIAYQPLANELPDNCQLFGVRMPGHDFSKPDDVGGTIEELVATCVEEVKEKIEGPISVYAQCVGGAIALALTYALEQEGIKVSVLFEAANFPSPRLPGKFSEWWNKLFPRDIWMSNRVYRETLKSLGNSDETNNVEEENFIIAGIRHDARMANDYYSSNYYNEDLEKIKAPICCIIGARDRSTEFYEERYHEWERYSNKVSLEVIQDTGHFFQKHQPKELCGIITEQVMAQDDNQRLLTRNNKQQKLEVIEGDKTSVKTQMSMKLFFIIVLGQVISILGSNLSSYAIGIWMYGKTNSIGNFSLISIASLVPSIVLAPFAGAVADRYDKRKIMILGDLSGILGTLFVFIMYSSGQLQVWHVCLGVFIGSIGSTFQRPAFLSAIPMLVPKCYLGQADGILQFVTSGGQMLGPILGAGALQLLGMKGVLLTDFVTCFATVSTLLMIRFPERIFKKREEPFMKEIIGGWHYITRRHSLVVMVVFFIVANFLMSLVTVIFTPLAIGVSSSKELGFVLGANAAGVVAGSIIMSLWGGTKRRASGMVGFLILTSASMILMGLRPNALIVGVGLFLFGMSIAFVNTHWQIMIQSKVGLELQGRVFSVNEMLVFAFRPFAFLLAPVLCDNLFTPLMSSNSKVSQMISYIIGTGDTRGMALLTVSVGIVLLIWSIGGMEYKPLRYMEDYLPDAIPGAVIYEDKDKMQESLDRAIS